MVNVLQTWVLERCTLRMQGVLILSLRGPDGVRKEDAAKPLVRTLRAMIMNSGRLGVPMEKGEFFVGDRFMTMAHISDQHSWNVVCKEFFDQMDAYNIHFLQHMIHAYAIIGIYHPLLEERERAWKFYSAFCVKLHMYPEKARDIEFRLRDGIRPESDD